VPIGFSSPSGPTSRVAVAIVILLWRPTAL
jgi:hypothetical protein